MKKFILLLSFFITLKIQASHVMGADFEYQCLGKDSFYITVKVYKDCKGVNLSPIALIITPLSAGCSWSTSASMTQVSCEDITPVCKKSCSKCDRQNCNANGYPNGSNSGCAFQYGMEKLTFKYLLVFPSSINSKCCKFRVSYEQCCRNGNITTCCAGDNFFSYAEFDRCVKPCNSSPVLANDPVAILCAGNCICLNNGARDTANFDSISYNLSSALAAFGTPTSYNNPYTAVPGKPGAASGGPLQYKGFPKYKPNPAQQCSGFVLDSVTGDLCFTPQIQQVGVLAIDIIEWRRDSVTGKMVKIGLTRRDMQIIIMANCTNKPPVIKGPFSQIVCANDLVCFTDMQITDPDMLNGAQKDSVRVKWNFGIPKATFTKKWNGKNEEWTLCWQTTNKDAPNNSPKTYFFNITAFDDACPIPGQTSRNFSITVKPSPESIRTFTDLGCGKWKFNILPKENYKSTPTYTWIIPYPGGSIFNIKDTSFQFSSSGNKIIKSRIEVNGCDYEILDTIEIKPFPQVILPNDTIICINDSIIINSSIINAKPPIKYNWIINGNIQSDTTSFLKIKINNDTKIIILSTDSNNCQSKDTINIKIESKPIFEFPLIKKCNDHFEIFILSNSKDSFGFDFPGIFNYRYNYDTTIINGFKLNISKLKPTTTINPNWINSTFITNRGCKWNDSFQVYIDSLPKIIIKDTSFCVNNLKFNLTKYAKPNTGVFMDWFGKGIQQLNNIWYFNPKIAGVGIHKIQYQVEDINGCKAKDSASFIILDLPKSNLKNLTTCVGVNIDSIYDKIIKHNYKTTISNSNIINNKFISNIIGVSKIIIYFSDSFGCQNIDTVYITIFPLPKINCWIDNDSICDGDSIINLHSDNIGEWYLNNNISDSIIKVSSLNYGINKIQFIYKDTLTKCIKDTIFLVYKIKTPLLELITSNICEDKILNISLQQFGTTTGFIKINNSFVFNTYNPTQQDIIKQYIKVYYGDSISFCKTLYSHDVKIYKKPYFNIQLPNECEPVDLHLTITNDTNYDCFYTFNNKITQSNKINEHIISKTDSIKENYNLKFYIKNKNTGCDTNYQTYGEIYKPSKAFFTINPSKSIPRNPGKVYFKEQTSYTDQFLWVLPDTSINRNVLKYYNNEFLYPDTIYKIILYTNNIYGCKDFYVDTLIITPNLTVFIPNAFTPNNVGPNKNNYFWIEANNYKGFNFSIYNRWGEKLFYSDQRLPGWNGWYKGNPCQEDVYVYEVNIQDIYDKWYHFNGTITLLR